MKADLTDDVQRAALAISRAEALIIGAGAGMGVDSGMPDFRGAQGFWRAYPPFAKLGLRFEELANPRHFAHDPPLAWGFYGHRRNLYRSLVPHAGFATLRQWSARAPLGSFVFTSNVDHHFQKAGFEEERVYECHGSIEWNQCRLDCGQTIFEAGSSPVQVDEETFRARKPLPACPGCGAVARPNILMFGDGYWDSGRSDAQALRLENWVRSFGSRTQVVVVELGAGTAVPSVRRFCESLAGATQGLLIRINPREPEVPRGHLGLPLGALEALQTIDQRLSSIA